MDAKKATIPPATDIQIMKVSNESIRPVIANPLGDLKIPINEKRNPNIPNTTSATGIQHKINDNKANTKPAVPQPLLLGSTWVIIIC